MSLSYAPNFVDGYHAVAGHVRNKVSFSWNKGFWDCVHGVVCSDTGRADHIYERDVTWPERVGAHPVDVRVGGREPGAERHVVSQRRAAAATRGRHRRAAAGQVRNYIGFVGCASRTWRQRRELHVWVRQRRRTSVDNHAALRPLYARYTLRFTFSVSVLYSVYVVEPPLLTVDVKDVGDRLKNVKTWQQRSWNPKDYKTLSEWLTKAWERLLA